MERFYKTFFVFELFAVPVFGSEWRLDSDEIQSASLREAEATLSRIAPSDELDRALWLQAAGHLAWEASRPHAGRKYFLAVEGLCDSWQQRSFSQFEEGDRARANAVCALVEAELAIHPFPFFSYFRLRKGEKYAQAFLLGEIPAVEKHYATARLRAALPTLGGLSFRASLLSFRVLERLSPQTKGVHYWLAQTFRRQGQGALSVESLERAVKEGDPRAVLVSPGIDGLWGSDLSYGFTVYPFTTPAKYQGLGLRYWDDRLEDGPLSLLVSTEASLRGNLSGNLQVGYHSKRWGLTTDFEGGRVVRDFFGLGMQGSSTVLGFPTTHLRGQVSLVHRVGDRKTVSVGPFFQMIDASAFTGAPFASVLGGFASFVWDSRDRPVQAREGVRVGLKARALGSSLGSALLLEAAFSAQRTLGLHHTFSFQVSTRSAWGSLPVNALPDLYQMEVPLTREFRFQDLQAAATFFTYRWRTFPWANLSAFLVTGSVADRWERVFRSASVGAGIGFDFQFERIPRFSPRWEVGIFAGEWIFQSAAKFYF